MSIKVWGFRGEEENPVEALAEEENLVEALAEEEKQIAIREMMERWSVNLLKCIPGFIRFVFEDFLNGYCQLCYLLKYWHDNGVPASSKCFTLGSIAVGLLVSLYGPLKDFLSMRSLRTQAAVLSNSEDFSGLVLLDDFEQDADALVEPQRGSSGLVVDSQPYQVVPQDQSHPSQSSTGSAMVPAVDADHATSSPLHGAGALDQPLVETSVAAVQGTPKGLPKKARGRARRAGLRASLSDARVHDYIRGADPDASHWREAHRMLVVCSGLYWLAMAGLVPLFGAKVNIENSVPLSSVTYFLLVSNICILLEIWVVIHTRHGLIFLQNVQEHVLLAFKGVFTGFMAILALLFSMLGRLDTYTDIMFTVLLFKDAERTGEDITWISFGCESPDSCESGFIFHFYIPLKYVSLFAVVFGVFVAQAIPGMVLLCRGQYLPAAFKLNEFNFLLAVTELEVAEDGV